MTNSTQATNRTNPVVINTSFGMPMAPIDMVAMGLPVSNDHRVPALDKHYVFLNTTLRPVLNFLAEPDGDGFFLWGHYGSGKTTLLYQVAARLNWPVQSMTAHGRMEFDDLVGCWKMVNGNMTWLEGPLTIAMKQGHIFVLNEGDRADPGQLAGLHDILEGHPLVVAANGGEVVYPHPDFRVVMNGNSAGSGDMTGLYQGVNQLDVAFMDRFRVKEVEYPTPDIEDAILSRKVPMLPKEVRENMITVANNVRRLFIGAEESAQPLTITMSTRSLCRWAKLTLDYRGAPNALSLALDEALLSKAEPEQQIAIERIAKDAFGSNWSQGD